MTTPMTCALFEDRLMAYLEQDVDDATRVAMDRHAVSCDDCGALVADLRKLRFDAANLPPLAPSRDLWAGIAARIEAPVVSIGGAGEPRATVTRRRWTAPALAAASLLLAAALGYYGALRRTSTVTRMAAVPAGDTAVRVAVAVVEPPTAPDTTAPPAAARETSPAAATARTRGTAPVTLARNPRLTAAQSILVADHELTRDYNTEIARLRALIEARRNQLDPVTVAIIERNVAVIDTAIAQCRAAIARDPASRFLLESLNQSLQTKLELMRTAALLPSRT